MSRSVLLAAAVATGTLAIAGCGAGGTPPGSPPPLAQAPAAVSVEATDGRLGDATEVRPGEAARALSRGGAPDVTPRTDGPRRDGVGAGAKCADADLAPARAALGAVAEATLCLLNGERADRGLAPLALNGDLGDAADAYAKDLVAGSYFSHTGRDGSDVRARIQRTGYIPRAGAWRIGENLAWGTGALATPGAIMRAWMNSSGHRANIMNPAYREIGIGVAAGNPARRDGAGATYATEFGVVEGSPTAAAKPKAKARPRKARRGARHAGARKGRVARRAHARSVTGRAPDARIAS